VRRTPKLDRYVAAQLPKRASEISGHTHPDLLGDSSRKGNWLCCKVSVSA
jgi:hypothetical protein